MTYIDHMGREWTLAQIKAALSNVKAEYKISKSIQAQYPSDENLHYCKMTYARIERIKASIERINQLEAKG